MKRIAVVMLLLVCLVVCSGCFRTVYRGDNLPFNASMSQVDPSREVMVRHFEEEKWNHYFLYALVPTSEPDLRDVIGRDVPAGCEVRNLTIRHEMTFVNGVIWFLIGWIYAPMTTTVSGDVVRIQGAAAAVPAAPMR